MKKTLGRIIWVVLAICLCISPLQVYADSTSTYTITLNLQYGQTAARSMLDMINEFRTGDEAWYWSEDNSEKVQCSDLASFTYDYELEKIAMLRAAEIAASFSHTRPNGTSCFTAYTEAGYVYSTIGENIAAGYSTAAAAFTDWKEDDDYYSGQGHRRNMLASGFNRIGIGHVICNGIHYWVQEFAKSTTSNTATTANDSETSVEINVAASNITSVTYKSDITSISLNCGATSVLPILTIYPKIASYWGNSNFQVDTDYTWISSDSSIAVVEDGVLKAVSAGSTNITANVLGYTVSIPVTVEHNWDYNNITWNWAEDYSSATASVSCVSDSTHVNTVEAEISYVIGETSVTYTAKALFGETEYTDTKTIEIKPSVKISLELVDGIIIRTYIRGLPYGTNPEDYVVNYNDIDGNYISETLVSNEENLITIEADAPEMTEKVNLSIEYQGNAVYSNSYSVQRYCDNVINNSSNEKLKALCYSILDYGAYSQICFNKNTDALANENNSDSTQIKDIPEVLTIKTPITEDITKVTTSLNLKSKTEMNFYFTPGNGVSADDISFEVLKDGKTTEDYEVLVKSDGRALVKVTDIAAAELADTITITAQVNGADSYKITSSPVCYLYSCQNNSEIGSLCKALYNYYEKAVAYFNDN